jgi:hypothetical protein
VEELTNQLSQKIDALNVRPCLLWVFLLANIVALPVLEAQSAESQHSISSKATGTTPSTLKAQIDPRTETPISVAASGPIGI